MKQIIALSVVTLVSACGSSKSSTPSPAPAPATADATAAGPSGAAGPAGPVGAAGATGAKGAAGATGQTGATGAVGASGSAGSAGAVGPTGAIGATGATGAPGGIILFDKTGHEVGEKLSDDNGTVSNVLLFDGSEAYIDQSTGHLQPYQSFFCLYTTNNCSGTCYVYDTPWLNVLVSDTSGMTYVSSRSSPNQGAKTINSYVAADLSCTVGTLSTTASYIASPYSPPGLTFPLTAPMYWGLGH